MNNESTPLGDLTNHKSGPGMPPKEYKLIPFPVIVDDLVDGWHDG